MLHIHNDCIYALTLADGLSLHVILVIHFRSYIITFTTLKTFSLSKNGLPQYVLSGYCFETTCNYNNHIENPSLEYEQPLHVFLELHFKML